MGYFMSPNECMKIEDEARKFAQEMLSNLPAGCTMLHLEIMKDELPYEIDRFLGYHKSRKGVSLWKKCFTP